MNVHPMTARIEIGTSVHVEHDPGRDRLYITTVHEHRRLCHGLTGVAIAEHDSHGLCYEIEFQDGAMVTFDREELCVVPPATEEKCT
jgi:hypothetical protein